MLRNSPKLWWCYIFDQVYESVLVQPQSLLYIINNNINIINNNKSKNNESTSNQSKNNKNTTSNNDNKLITTTKHKTTKGSPHSHWGHPRNWPSNFCRARELSDIPRPLNWRLRPSDRLAVCKSKRFWRSRGWVCIQGCFVWLAFLVIPCVLEAVWRSLKVKTKRLKRQVFRPRELPWRFFSASLREVLFGGRVGFAMFCWNTLVIYWWFIKNFRGLEMLWPIEVIWYTCLVYWKLWQIEAVQPANRLWCII